MSKRTPLVCQHLENVSRTVWEEHQDIVREYVRHRQGVYALYRRGKLYYVAFRERANTECSSNSFTVSPLRRINQNMSALASKSAAGMAPRSLFSATQPSKEKCAAHE